MGRGGNKTQRVDIIDSYDPRVVGRAAQKGVLFRYIPAVGDPVVLIKNDDGFSTDWTSIGSEALPITVVEAGSTGNINLAVLPANVDGVVPTKFLAKDQTLPAENGVYDYPGVGLAATRSVGWDSASDFVPGRQVYVDTGTVNDDTLWANADEVATLGVDPVEFIRISNAVVTGDPNSFAFFDLTGVLSSINNVALSYNTTDNSLGMRSVDAGGLGLAVFFLNGGTANITMSGQAGLVNASTGGGPGNPLITSDAAAEATFVNAYLAEDNATFLSFASLSQGSSFCGWIGTTTELTINAQGTFCGGWYDAGASVSLSGNGAFLWAWSSGRAITVSGWGGFLGLGQTGDSTISGNGHWAIAADEIIGSAKLGLTQGLGHTNSTYLTAKFGRYSTDPGAGNESTWVDTDPLFVLGNGANAGSPKDGYKVDKDGRVTETAAKVNTAIRTFSTSDTVSDRTDNKILLDDTGGGVNTISLPAGEDGLTFRFSPTNGNTGTWALSPNGADALDGNIPGDLGATGIPKDITFLVGTWYYI